METKKKTFEELWEEVEENFKWKKVYNVMKLLDWTWCFGNERYAIPNVSTIKSHAREQCYEAYTRPSGYSSCGGFTATYEDNGLHLLFYVDEWSTH